MTARRPDQGALDRAFSEAAGNLSHKEMARLLALGADPNSRWNRDNEPAISHIAMHGDAEDLLLLLKYGVDVNATDDKGVSPLHMALEQGNIINAALLVQHGANINLQKIPGVTPPPWAVAIEYDQKYTSAHRTRFALDNGSDFHLAFEIAGKPRQTVWDVLDAFADRAHGQFLKSLVHTHIANDKQRRATAAVMQRRHQTLSRLRGQHKNRYRL